MTDTTAAATRPETQQTTRRPAIPSPRRSPENRRDRSEPTESTESTELPDYGYPAIRYAMEHLTLLQGRGNRPSPAGGSDG
jgi:hypothetical protein